MTLTASHTLDVMSFVHAATSKLGNLEDAQLYVAFMWVSIFSYKKERYRDVVRVQESPVGPHGHHLKLLQHDRWIKPVRKD